MIRHGAKWLLVGLFWLPLLSGRAVQAGEAVYIKPGETFSITGVPAFGRLIDLRRVEETVEGAGDILTFAFDDTGKFLTVESSFVATVKYRISVMDPVSGEYYPASTCPVSKTLSIYEHWISPIAQLRMTDFELLHPSGDRAGLCD